MAMGKSNPFPHPLERLDAAVVLLMGVMGEVEPGHVHTGPAHFLHGLFCLTGGTQRADNLGLSQFHRSLLGEKIECTIA